MEEINVSVPEKTEKKINKIIPVIIAVAALAVLVVCMIIFFGKGDSSQVISDEVTTEDVSEEYSEDASEAVTSGGFSMFRNGLLAVLKNGKWGYIDKNGKLVIDYQFETAGVFSDDGLAAVSIEGNYGLINKEGKFVINPQYEEISSSFNDGFAPVKKDDKYGFIDRNGKVVINCCYDYVMPFSNGYAVVVFGSAYGIIDTNGNYAVNPQYECLYPAYSEKSEKTVYVAQKDYKFGFIDINGKTVIDFQYDIIICDDTYTGFTDDKYAIVCVNDKYGVIDTDGKYIINTIYHELYYCGNDMFVFSADDTDKYGLISVDGNEIIPTQFDAADYAGNGLILVKLGDYYGYIDKSGKYAVNPVFDKAFAFRNGYAVVMKNDKYSFIDTDGKLVVDYQFDDMTDFNSEGYAIVRLDNRYGIINSKGEYVVNCQYYYAKTPIHAISYEPLADDCFCVAGENKILQLITADGKVIISDYDGISGEMITLCDSKDCYSIIYGDSESGYCYEHEPVSNNHTVNYYYGADYTAYLLNPKGKTTVYTSCGVVAENHCISGYDPVIIHEVYTDGCCLVSYVTDSGITRTYYAKISDFTTHKIDWNYNTYFTAYLRNPSGRTTVYTNCGVIASDHWISGYDPVIIHEVYTDGCCLVSYVTDSGITRTYYADIYDFIF